MSGMSKSDAKMLDKPVSALKKAVDKGDAVKMKAACDELDEMLKYADKRDGAYDSSYTK